MCVKLGFYILLEVRMMMNTDSESASPASQGLVMWDAAI